MLRTERIFVYGLLILSLAIAAGAGSGLRVTSAAAAASAPVPAIDPAKLATCDIYVLVERLVETPAYAPARDTETAKAKAVLEPLEKELDAMEQDIRSSDQQSQQTKDKIRAFEGKRNDYMGQRQKAADAYSELVVGQFSDAYQKVIAEARRVAESKGFGYVIAQKMGEIRARSLQLLVEEFLARPVAIAPEGVDITDAVRVAMKLPAAPPSAPMIPLAPDKK